SEKAGDAALNKVDDKTHEAQHHATPTDTVIHRTDEKPGVMRKLQNVASLKNPNSQNRRANDMDTARALLLYLGENGTPADKIDDRQLKEWGVDTATIKQMQEYERQRVLYKQRLGSHPNENLHEAHSTRDDKTQRAELKERHESNPISHMFNQM